MTETSMCLANRLNFVNENQTRETEKADYSSRNKQSLARSKILSKQMKKKRHRVKQMLSFLYINIITRKIKCCLFTSPSDSFAD